MKLPRIKVILKGFGMFVAGCTVVGLFLAIAVFAGDIKSKQQRQELEERIELKIDSLLNK